MPALRSRDDQQLTTVPTPTYNSKPQAHDIDALAAMSMYDHSQGAILSPTPRALSFPNHPMLDITLDGPTPRAFTFPTSVRDARGPPLTPPEPSPSTPSTSSSPFEPEQRPQNLYPQFSQQPQFTAPPIARRSQSMQRVRTATASPAAQLSSFNAPDPAPGAPLTLAARRRGSSISSLALPSHPASQIHTLSLAQSMSQPAAINQAQPQPQPHNPHAHAIQLAGTERRPKRGDEDYIKRPENAFILFRRECCLKKNEAEAAAANEGDPIARRQRQADLSKTISQQWRSLSAEDRKYWDDLAKQRKKEHEEMYPWYVYQPTRATKEKKGTPESAAGGKVRREKDGKSHRRDRTKSSSRARGSRARNSSSCSTASTSSMMSASSSASTVDSEDFSELDSMSGDGSLYGAYGYANGGCSSVREVEMADYADFDESEGSHGQEQTLSLPLSLSMPGASGSGAGSLAIDTRNALASFSLESGPISTSSYSHSHHGHGHSHSAQISSQAVQSIMPGPLSFVLPQNRRSTSAPGAPTTPPMPSDLYPSAPSAIKIPQLLETNPGSNESSAVVSPKTHNGGDEEQRVDYTGLNGFQFPNSHSQPMVYDIHGQVPNFTAAGGDMQHNSMFQVFDQQVPATAKPRQRALSQLAIPSEPSTSNGGPLSAPPPQSSISSSSSHHLYLPGSFSPPSVQSPGGLQVPGQRAVPQGLPQSPEPPTAENEWDDYGLPAWAMPALCDPDENAASSQTQNQNQEQMQVQSAFGEIEIGMDMGMPPWMSFGMGSMGSGIDGMGMDGERLDPYAINFQFEDLLDPSQL